MREDKAWNRLRESLGHLKASERALIERAMHVAAEAHEGQERADGAPYLSHLIAVAQILADWKADADTIIAGLLHDALEDSPLGRERIEEEFGLSAGLLVDGVTKFTQADLANPETHDRKVETLRKLLDVMRKDIRVIIIKLADRLHNVRTIDALPLSQREKFARETMDVYAKLAYHLGMNALRRELAEICVPIIAPDAAHALLQLREDTEAERREALARLRDELKKRPGVPQHAVDIRIGLRGLDTLLDLQRRGELKREHAYYVMLITRRQEDCYALLQFLHTLYRPLSGKFRDFIAAPTAAGYRSLHTSVVGPLGAPLQVRIRTHSMEEEDQQGVALRLFGRGKEDVQDLAWLRRSESLDEDTKESSDAFWKALQTDIFRSSVQVTVDGETVSIPVDATVLDAVYARYGANAHRLRFAEVDGERTALGTKLNEDSVVRTTMGTESQASIERMDAVTTRYARSLIVDALKRRSREEKIMLGERLVQKELDYFQRGLLSSVSKQQQDVVAEHFRRATFEDVIAMVGEGVLDAKEVVFELHPDIKPSGLPSSAPHTFRLHVTGALERRQDVLQKLSEIARPHDVEILHTDLQFKDGRGTFELSVGGRTPDTHQFADFAAALDREEWTSGVQTLILQKQRLTLAVSFIAAFAVIVLDVVLLPHYHKLIGTPPFIPALLLQLLPLLPVFAVNWYLLWLLRHYIAQMRSDRWYLGLGFVLNVAGMLVVLKPGTLVGNPGTILPLSAVFAVLMLLLAYRFFQTEALFHIASRPLRNLPAAERRKIFRRKTLGYCFRIGAVIIWGIQPLYLKYTPANDVPPFYRLFLMSVGILLVSGALFGIKHFLTKRKSDARASFSIPWNRELLWIIVGAALFTYFLNASLQLTTSTNFILFNNFSPALALLAAVIFWRQSIPYLREPRTMLWIFLIFLLGSIGSSLLIYNDIIGQSEGTVYGDVLGLLAMLADTLYVVGQIRYMKTAKKASSLAINIHVASALIVISLPPLVWLYARGVSTSAIPVLFALGAGVLSGIGQMLNYETFRRIDGFIAFLLFNFSILITFVTEVFFLGKVFPTSIILIGGSTIIVSAILAEWINTRSERRG